MANSAINLAGTLTRMLQLGVDHVISHLGKDYVGPYRDIFEIKQTDKAYYELLMIAGMTPAGQSYEGQVITMFDTIDQDQNAHYAMVDYSKAARATKNAIDDNLYEDLPKLMLEEIVNGHEIAKDIAAASILNNATTTNWGDGVPLLSTAHPLQAGGTTSNRLSPDQDLSADAIQSAKIAVDAFLNPNGNLGDYEMEKLWVPPALQFVAQIALGSRYKPSSADNDINPVSTGLVPEGYQEWRRLTNAKTWFITTNQPGLVLAEREGVETKVFQDEYTWDTVVNSRARFRCLVEDGARCVVGSVGP